MVRSSNRIIQAICWMHLYRPPGSDRKVNKSINEAISAAAKLSNEIKYDNVLIMGDFN